jgi:transketolase
VFACDGHDYAEIRQCAATTPIGAEGATDAGPVPHAHRQGQPRTRRARRRSHGAPLGVDEVRARRRRPSAFPTRRSTCPTRSGRLFTAAADRNRRIRTAWNDAMQAWRDEFHERYDAWNAFASREVPDDLFAQLLEAVDGGAAKGATRALASSVLQKAYELVPSLVGGSADLNGSTKTDCKTSGLVGPRERKARNIAFGVREHAMGAILNGLALHGGYLPLGSTFLVFSDYCRPAIRLAALMQLPVTFVFTHDSVMVGEDGPTHEPIEHTSALRLIPNLHVWRPADGIECAAAWASAIERRDGPSTLVLTRQDIEIPQRDDGVTPEDARRGGYVLHDPEGAVATVIATGSETGAVRLAADELAKAGKPIRVVSMPCVEVFLAQDEDWRARVLPNDLPTYAVELGSTPMWARFTGTDPSHVIGLDRFGESAPWKVLRDHFGFTPARLAETLRERLG